VIKIETVTIGGKELVKTYSDSDYFIDCDGIKYADAYDVPNSNKVYTETNIRMYKGKTPEEIAFLKLPYPDRVSKLIRDRYSLDDELALSRQRETKQEEFEAYFAYCEECKERARGD